MCVSLCFSVFAFGVSATSSDGSFWLTNILDYISISDDGNIFDFTGYGELKLNLPFTMSANYVDMVFYSTRKPDGATFISDSSTDRLTIVSVGNNLYRIYGNVTLREALSFRLAFATYDTSAYVSCYFYQINFGNYNYSSTPTTGTLNISYPNVTSNSMSSATSPAQIVIPSNASSSKYVDFGGYVTISDWRKFDALDIFLNIDSATVNSVVASLGSVNIPCDLQFIDGMVPGFDSSIGDNTTSVSVLRYVRLTLDLTNLKRSGEGSIQINFTGMFDAYQTATITLQRVTGYVSTTVPDASVSWLRSIYNSVVAGFDRIAELLNPDSTVVDESISQADQAISDIHDMEQQYAADLDSSVITGEVSKVENYGNALVFCGSVLSRTFTQLEGYQIIYILPICVGLFLFVASRARPIHVPRQHSAPKANDTQVLDNKEG